MQTENTNYLNIIDIIRQNRKSLKLVITREGKVIAYIPVQMTLEKVKELINKKADWITKNLKKINTSYLDNKNILTYKQILICGEIYDIQSQDKIKKIVLDNSTMQIPQKFFIDKNYIIQIKRWYKSFSKQLLTKRTEELAKLHNMSFKTVKIGDFKAKWGSCDQNKNIKLNWRLAMLAPTVIDYVIIHEFCHVYEMNHSRAFYEILQNVLPNWKEERTQIKENNYLLSLYRNK